MVVTDLTMVSVNISDIAITTVKNFDSEAVNLLNNFMFENRGYMLKILP